MPQLVVPIAFNVVMSLIAGPGGRFELLSRRWALAVLTTAFTVAVCGRVLDVLPFLLNYQVVLIVLSLAGPISFLLMDRLRMPERTLPPHRPRPSDPPGNVRRTSPTSSGASRRSCRSSRGGCPSSSGREWPCR